MGSKLKYLLIAGLAWGAAGCGSSDGEPVNLIESLRFEQSAYVESGESLQPRLLIRIVTQAHESVYDADENPYSMSWSGGDPAVAAVSASGVVTRVAPGTTTLTVRTPLYPTPVTTSVTFEQRDLWVGEWVLSSWEGDDALAGKVYVELTRDNRFTLYQNGGQPGFTRFRGDYAVSAEHLLTGTYADGTSLGDSYAVAADEERLTLTGTTTGHVSVYDRTTIPDWVKEEVPQSAAAKGAAML